MTPPRLNRALLDSRTDFPADLEIAPKYDAPIRIVQFGEGNFLRAFADWMIDVLNEKGLFSGEIAVVKPRAHGDLSQFVAQDHLFTVLLRGLEKGQIVQRKRVVQSIGQAVHPYQDFAAYLELADNPDLRFVISNTTEAGIVFNPADKSDDAPADSFPGKLTQFLHRRYMTFDGDINAGLVLLPCELIENNGNQLKAAILQTAGAWKLERRFTDWVNSACPFCNTLVDRIVSGFPGKDADAIGQELGYRDSLLSAGEIYHFWAIQAPAEVSRDLPLDKAGLNVLWTDDLLPYRTRKVRILNGAHTMIALGAFLIGKNTVGECVDDPAIAAFIRNGILEEIIPTLDMPREELESFANAVLERFANPFIRHELLSISLNSVAKFKARVLPSLLAYQQKFGRIPQRLAWSLAALICFYRGSDLQTDRLIGSRNGEAYPIRDDLAVLEAMRDLWATADVAGGVLARADWWGMDLNALPGLGACVRTVVQAYARTGVLPVMP